MAKKKTYQIRLILQDVAYDSKSEDMAINQANNYRLIGCEWVGPDGKRMK